MQRFVRAALLGPLALGPLAAQESRPATAPADTPAARVGKALTTAQHKNRRALVAFLGEDPQSKEIAAAMKSDRTLARQLQYEFAIAVLAPGDADAVKGLGAAPTKGKAPALVVLDADGKRLAEFEATALASEGSSSIAGALGKLLAPLHCQPIDAEPLLAKTLASVKEQKRTLLLHFDAPW